MKLEAGWGLIFVGSLNFVGLFYNGTTGQLKCFNITDEFVECADPTGCGIGPASLSWDFQVCLLMLTVGNH